MAESPLRVRKAAVLGAGVMGAQIAAHFANAGIPVLLLDLAAAEGGRDGIVDKAVAHLSRLEPAPLAAADRVSAIERGNYDDALASLRDCDVIIEAIAERLEWKKALYERIAPFLGPGAILATNTSGLSIGALAQACPDSARERFCGVHFFNPPRYMHLVEIIPHAGTRPDVLDALETLLVTGLGKGVVRARDTPNFIANRVGVFSLLATMAHTERLGLGYDAVDALTGPAIGRPRSATYRTCDVVGLDTLAHVIRTMEEGLRDDPWQAVYRVPPVLAALIGAGALGQKSARGYYRKEGRDILVLDPGRNEYRASTADVDPAVAAVLAIESPTQRFRELRALAAEAAHPQADFLWSIFRDVFHYCAFHLGSIADNARDVDFAMRWGFGWRQGPFETWQAAGWHDIAAALRADIAAGRALATVPLPDWVFEGPASAGVHSARGSYSPPRGEFRPRSALAVYKRQFAPDPMLGEDPPRGVTILETAAVRVWHGGDDIAIVSFKSKQNTIGEDVLDGVLAAIDEAEARWAGLVIWQSREPFSFGANLASVMPAVQAGAWDKVDAVVAKFQRTSQRLKYSLVPTVAAVRGLALGGGCELVMHCDRAVAALESYIGLVEVGVGLLPAGGGSKEFALRAAELSARGGTSGQIDHLPFLRAAFELIARATVSKSALHAKELGYLRPSDVVIMNPHELLHVARSEARALAEAGYRPPLPRRDIAAGGKTAIATLEMLLVNMREGGFISAYDFEVCLRVARVLCGGEIESGVRVDERWFLEMERREFMALIRDARTQERVAHTLKTGKPLRN